MLRLISEERPSIVLRIEGCTQLGGSDACWRELGPAFAAEVCSLECAGDLGVRVRVCSAHVQVQILRLSNGAWNMSHTMLFLLAFSIFLPLLNSWTTPFCATEKASRENDETVTLSVEEAGLRSGDTLLITVINGVRKELPCAPNTIKAKRLA